MESMQSFFDDYCKGEPASLALKSFVALNPKHEFACLLLKLYNSIFDKKFFIELLPSIKNFDYQNCTELERLFYFWFLAETYSTKRMKSNLLSVISHVKSFNVNRYPLEIQIIPIYLEQMLVISEGDFAQYIENSQNLQIKLKDKSKRYSAELSNYLEMLCYFNKHDEFNKLLNEYKTLVQNKSEWHRYIHLEAINSLELADFKMLNIKTIELENYIHLPYIKEAYSIFKNICAIVDNKTPEEKIDDVINEYYVVTIACMLKKEYQNALKYAHKAIEIEKIDLNLPHFFSYNIFRAELANNNANTVLYSLQKRESKNNKNMHDDFFYFRVYHQKNERKLAQQYFNKYYDNIIKYNSIERFEFEVSLSPELSPTTLMNYACEYKNIPFQDKTINNSNQTKNSPNITIVGNSDAIKNIKETILKIATIKTPVLIIGETGVGKDLVATAIHSIENKNKPYLPINCASIPEYLLLSELFGHAKGAFTNAQELHKGIFEEARDGTVFLDEIGDISLNMQIALLRVLETGEYRPLGSNKTKKIQCKIIMATNQDLNLLVKKGKFREDFKYRLERLIVKIPPLRERREDIPLLIEHFLNENTSHISPIYFDENAMNLLCMQAWEGNIRELKNEMVKVRMFYSDQPILTTNELSTQYQTLKPIKNYQNKHTHNKNFNQKEQTLKKLKNFFDKQEQLSRIEVSKLLGITSNTANNYLKTLERQGFIRKFDIPRIKSIYYKKI